MTYIYILIHGAWQASYVWQRLAPILTQAGHTVITPDLPGHGTYLTAKPSQFNDYSNYIIDLIYQQSLPVIVVGHSLAGLIISQVASLCPYSIEQLIYINALLPKNSLSPLQLARKYSRIGLSKQLYIDQLKEQIILGQNSFTQYLLFNQCPNIWTTYGLSQLKPEPLYPLTNALTVDYNKLEGIKKTFIVGINDKAITLNQQRRMLTNWSGNIIELLSDHSPFFSCPEKLAEILLNT